MKWVDGPTPEQIAALEAQAQHDERMSNLTRDSYISLSRAGADKALVDAAWETWTFWFRKASASRIAVYEAEGMRLPTGLELRARATAHAPGSAAYDGLWDEYDERRAG